MKYWVVLGIIVLAVILVPAAVAQKADANAGKAVYTSKCAMCHGALGEGKDAMAKMLKVEIRHLGSKEVQAKSDADLKKVVTEGTGKMKGVTGLKDAEVANLIAYARTFKK